jgi:hypothetical protein
VSFYIAPDVQAPSSGKPSGVSLLQDYGGVDSVRGEGVQIVLNHEIEVRQGGSCLKVYAVNDDYYDHSVDVDVEIQVEQEGA